MAADGELLAVDPYQPGRLGFSCPRVIAHSEVRRVRNGGVTWLQMTGVEAARVCRETARVPIDFIFIDGDHSYEGLRADWEAWSPLVAPDGIIALHDSCPSPTHHIEAAGSVAFTREVILRDPLFEVIETINTLTVIRRRPLPSSH
jgi:predicted O-methyltransferase YrrM